MLTNKAKPVSKSAFVRSLPADMPAKAVLAKAKSAGLTLSKAYVYNIRAVGKKTKTKGSTGHKRGPGRPRSSDGIEGKFLSLVLDVGLVRAQELLANVRARVAG